MTQGLNTVVLLLLALWRSALAEIHHWPSTHVALSNDSVFLRHSHDQHARDRTVTVSVVDMEKNATMLSRAVSTQQLRSALEFNCTCFPYAGRFRFRVEDDAGEDGNATQWWSEVLHVRWPTFHISVERTSNHSSSSFQVGIATDDSFQACVSGGLPLYLEVSYLEYNQIGKSSIDKVRARRSRDIGVARLQKVQLECEFPFTERDYVTVALKSRHVQQDVKTSGPLYLSRIFPYRLQVENAYGHGCEGAVTARLLPPPCAFTGGKVALYRDGGWGGTAAASEDTAPPLTFKWLAQGENETEFNCSLFDPGQNRYCFRFILNFSSRSLAQECIVVHRSAETWGPWQPWSSCSVSCGEGVRLRFRECLLPPAGGWGCASMGKEQSHCSLESCVVPLPSLSPLPPTDTILGGNLVAVTGISLCLGVIVVTVLVTVWRRACHAPKCGSMRQGSLPSPGGRKNSDEASICGHSLQRPSFSESVQVAPPDPTASGLQQGMPLPQPAQDPDRLSPAGQKIVPPIFGYRLAQQQLKEMKKKGLTEATQVYHVSQSPIDDTVLEAATTSAPLTPVLPELDGQEEANAGRFRITSPFTEVPKTSKPSSVTLPDRLSPRGDLAPGPPQGYARRHEHIADWVEMVERMGACHSRNSAFRRTSSFHESKAQQPTRPFRERSMTQVTPRQVPEGSCRARAWESTRCPEWEGWNRHRATPPHDGSRGLPNRAAHSLEANRRVAAVGMATTDAGKLDFLSEHKERDRGPGTERVERAELNWSRRGPSPIQRNILARKLKEANASATWHRQRTAVGCNTDLRWDKCRSLPLPSDGATLHGSHYGLTEAEQRMMDLSGYLGEENDVQVVGVHRLT